MSAAVTDELMEPGGKLQITADCNSTDLNTGDLAYAVAICMGGKTQERSLSAAIIDTYRQELAACISTSR